MEDYPYLAMVFVNGQTITSRCFTFQEAKDFADLVENATSLTIWGYEKQKNIANFNNVNGKWK